MSMPACQQRVLNHIEGALQASDPHLAAMYAIFTRLNAGAPVGAESLVRRRLPRRAAAVWAAVLVPLMFVIIAIGAQLGGSARGATGCGPAHSASRGVPLVSRASCAYNSPGAGSPKRHVKNTLERRVPCQSSSSGRTQRNC
jgi:Protein of unknown function (DUF3040)